MASKKMEPATKAVAAVLDTWVGLNDHLREATEEQCTTLLRKERAGKRRVQYLLRIHARLNKVRASRERSELLKESK